MSTTTQTTGILSIECKKFYEKTLLARLLPAFKLYNLAKKKVLPKNIGKTISWRKFGKLTPPANPLSEGVTPDGNNLSIYEYEASVNQYGDWIKFSDLVDLMGIDPILTETAALFGEEIAEKFDGLIRDKLITSTNVKYVGDEAAENTITASDTINIADIAKVKALMQKRNVQPWVDGKYLFIIDSDVEYDLKNLASNGFIDVWKYAQPDKVMDGEIGEFMGFKFIVNDAAIKVSNTGASNAAVHKCIVLGKVRGESPFGVIELEGENGRPEILYKGLGSAGTEDPLNQKQTMGWNVRAFAPVILYEEGVMVYKCGSGLASSDWTLKQGEDSTADNYSANGYVAHNPAN